MKKRGLFLSALFMSAVFAGCSNEEVLPDVEPREVKNSDSYIAVNIVAPGVDSRGEGGDFEAGVGVFGVGTCSHRHICTPHSQQGLAALQHQFSYLQYHKTTPIVK